MHTKQSSGQFGVPPPEVPPRYNPASNTINNNNSNSGNRSTSTAGSTQALRHTVFNFCTPHEQHAPLSSSAAHNPHSSLSQPVPPVLLGKAVTHDGTAELFQESDSPCQQQSSRCSHILQSTPEHVQATKSVEHIQTTENVHQEQIVHQKQGNVGKHGQAQVTAQAQGGDQAQSMQMHHQLSLRLDQGCSEAGGMPCKSGGNGNQQVSTDPLSLGDVEQADEGGGAGNRWPRQETLVLLKIRADMDAAFRDSSVKRPLWDEVSRKMGELGYERSAKKCKEKFENVNKYYKRTKEGKVGRQDGKNYRFFTQLEALSANHNTAHIHNTPSNISTLTPSTMLISTSISSTIDTITKFKAAASHDLSLLPFVDHPPPSNDIPPLLLPICSSAPPLPPSLVNSAFRPPFSTANASSAPLQLSSPSCCDDDDGDDEDDEDAEDDDTNDDHDNHTPGFNPSHEPAYPESKKRKRKSSTSMMAFFEGLLKRVLDKQEQMQQRLLQALERRETDRMIREEAWKRQEIARLSKEHELRAQERSSAVARDAALIAFLQKASGQTIDLPAVPTSMPVVAQPVLFAPPLHPEGTTSQQQQQFEDQDPSDPNSKRWLKPEVLSLIELHSNLQAKFTEVGPKGHLWEEIAHGMENLGYSSRTAKRCKEKWENINKYFKRAKESNKKRPENAKTCPYFQELEALYKKGLLGNSNANQLPYKPTIEHTQPHIDDDSVMQRPSSAGADGINLDNAHSVPVQPPSLVPSDRPGALNAYACSTNNSSVVGGTSATNRIVGDVGMKNINNDGGLRNKESPMQLSVDPLRSASGVNASSTSDHNVSSGARDGFVAELTLNSQQQSASMDVHQQRLMTHSDYGKSNAGGHQKESQLQSDLKESKPTILSPLPHSSSFMSSVLQKINGNNPAVNSITTNQDQ